MVQRKYFTVKPSWAKFREEKTGHFHTTKKQGAADENLSVDLRPAGGTVLLFYPNEERRYIARVASQIWHRQDLDPKKSA